MSEDISMDLDKNYQKIFGEISSIYETLDPENVNRKSLGSYWEMGERIVSLLQQETRSDAYGKQVMKQLGKDMNEKHGKRFAVRNLYYMRGLADSYEKENLNNQLTWNHYKILISIKDETKREQLEQVALENNVSAKKLGLMAKQIDDVNAVKGATFNLQPREGATGIYKVVMDHKGKPLLDLGFRTLHRTSLNLRNLTEDELITSEDEKFKRVKCKKGERYCYKGNVIEVVDGDTVWVRINLGFDNFVDKRLRLRGVNAPELLLPEGKKALAFVKRRIKPGESVKVFTYDKDIYGRYVADIIYGKERYLNKQIVESGMALLMDK